MKKIIALFLTFIIALPLTSCTHSGFLNLADFIESFNRIEKEGEQLELTSFSEESDGEGKIKYQALLNRDFMGLLILEGNDSGEIQEVRALLPRSDSEGKTFAVTQEQNKAYIAFAKRAAQAFTVFTAEQISQIFAALENAQTNKASEKEATVQQGSFYFQFISNKLCDEYIVRNKWLKETESTEKPESKAQNTIVITDTTLPK